MSERLSEEAVIQSLDSGWRSLVWKDHFSSKDSLLAPGVDFKAILKSKDPEAAAQVVPRRDMYMALVSRGPEEALEILPLISQEQFVAIMDNEAWKDGHLAIHHAMRWLDLYKHLGPEQLYKRFRQLDEEYQVALLNPYVEMVDEETFEKLDQAEQDRFTAMPCNTLWWRVKGGDDKVQEFVSSIISASISEDAAYVYSLLGMAAMLPPNEQEALLKQFRDARLEEDGFVTVEESRELFGEFDAGKALHEKWRAQGAQTDQTLPLAPQRAVLFMDSVLKLASTSGLADPVAVENVQKSFAYLANAVSAACRVEPDDVSGLMLLLQQVKCLTSFGLEVLSSGDERRAVEILFTEYPKTVFRFALSLFDGLRLEALSGLRAIDFDRCNKIELLWRTGKFGSALWVLDKSLVGRMAPESVEILKGLFNRFPMVKDEVISDANIWRVQFKPVATVADYRVLAQEVRGIFSHLEKEALQ